MRHCYKCGESFQDTYSFCPNCGNRLREPINSSEYVLSQISFCYDKIEECYDNGVFLGIRVWKGNKCGFIPKLTTRGLNCEYYYIRPHHNISPYSQCKAYASKIVYEVRGEGGWGIISLCPEDPFFNRDTGFIFDSVSFIEDYPACFIVSDKNEKEREFFYNINTKRRLLDYSFKYIRRVYYRNGSSNKSIYFACNRFEPYGGFCDVIDIVSMETAALQSFCK